MMVRSYVLIQITFALICFSDFSYAAEKIIGLDWLVKEALENNQSLRVTKYEALAKEAEIGPKGAYEDPMVGFAAQNYPVDTYNPREMGMTGNEISITQKVPFPGKLTKLQKATSEEYEGSRQFYSSKQLQVIKDVRINYYQLFLAYKKLDVLIEQRNVVRQLIATVRNKYTVGKAPQAELLNLQMEEANLIEQSIMAEKAITVKVGELNLLIGRPADHPLEGRPSEIPKTKLQMDNITEKVLGEKALKNNPEVKSAAHELSATEHKLTIAKLGYLPDFEFRVGYMMRQANPDDRGVNLVSGMVSMSIPIWAFTKQSEEVKGALAEKAKSESAFSETRLRLLQMVNSLFADLKEADRRLLIYEGGLLQIARQAVSVGRNSYLTGQIDYATLLGTLKNRFQTEINYFEALVSYESQIAALEALLTEPLQVGDEVKK